MPNNDSVIVECTDTENSHGGGWGMVCTSVCVCACVYTCARDVFAIYDNHILPTLIMIITKITFLYFIKIAQTDDFPSTGTRLVYITVVLFITVVYLLLPYSLFCLFSSHRREKGDRTSTPRTMTPDEELGLALQVSRHATRRPATQSDPGKSGLQGSSVQGASVQGPPSNANNRT